MPGYFYDYSVGGKVSRDAYGAVCADDQAAIDFAWQSMPKVMAETEVVLPWQHFELIVRRGDGVHIGRIGVTATVETPNPATATMLAIQKTGSAEKLF